MSTAHHGVLVLALVLGLGVSGPADATIAFSGIVVDPVGDPVADVTVWVFVDPEGEASATTDAGGAFTVEIPAGRVSIVLRAPLENRLAVTHRELGERAADFSETYTLRAGHLVTGVVLDPSAAPVSETHGVEVHPVSLVLPQGESLPMSTEPGTGAFGEVLPVGVYWLAAATADPPYSELVPVDLSHGDVLDLEIRLHDEQPIDTVPADPPVAELITVGPVDGLGEAAVVGAAGAAAPATAVLLVNVGSTHQASTVAAADGSFETRLFAPPGSEILIKHGPPRGFLLDLATGIGIRVTSLPGTFVRVPYGVAAGDDELPFAATGALDWITDDEPLTLNLVGSAWAIRGVLRHGGVGHAVDRGVLEFSPGDPIRVEGTLRVYGRALDATVDPQSIQVPANLLIHRIADAQGRMLPPINYFMSSVLTPTGLPIQMPEGGGIEAGASLVIGPFERVGDGCLEAAFTADGQVPDNAPPGLYQARMRIERGTVPSSPQGPAAQVRPVTTGPGEAPLPTIAVGLDRAPDPRRLVWWLLMENYAQGQRGTGAAEDRGFFALGPQIVTQGAPYVIPPADARTGQPIRYRLEPFLPTLTYVDRRVPSRPLIPFDLPGGELSLQITRPDGSRLEAGPAPFSRSMTRSRMLASGIEVNPGTQQLNDVYQLITGEHDFEVSFDQFGLHEVRMAGTVDDIWGGRYEGGGSYEVMVAWPLDIDPGVLPGMPLEVGEPLGLSLQILPRVPAEVEVTLTVVPDSDPARTTTATFSGRANPYGHLATGDTTLVAAAAGEYRVDLVASYEAPDGELFMGAMTWGGVVMTPPAEAQLIARGRRGLDALDEISPAWFVLGRDVDIPEGGVPHSFNAYLAGDILWSRMEDSGGDALLIVGTVFDTVGDIAEDIRARARRSPQVLAPPGTLDERVAAGELPLFLSSRSGLPAVLALDDLDQVAYAYRSSQRPGVRVREVVASDGETGGYWRLDTQYDEQPGVGFLGDQPNDFKLQFVGTVYRDLDSGHSEYGGQATGWIYIPGDDPVGTRVMPPFAGQGNGGWTTEGGPLLSLRGEPIDLFVVPTGVHPGTVLETGDVLSFTGHLMPPLGSSVEVVVTAPDGTSRTTTGRANRVGYLAPVDEGFTVDQPGVWTVEVRAWHDGLCSGGATVPPYPEGSVLGAEDGRFEVYVVPAGAQRLEVRSPSPGFLPRDHGTRPITLTGVVPGDLENPTLHYTIAMPGVILESGEINPTGGIWSLVYDPTRLHEEIPNIDLVGRDGPGPGLADTVSISLLLAGTAGDEARFRATTVTLQGEQVFVGGARRRPLPPPRPVAGRVEP